MLHNDKRCTCQNIKGEIFIIDRCGVVITPFENERKLYIEPLFILVDNRNGRVLEDKCLDKNCCIFYSCQYEVKNIQRTLNKGFALINDY